MKTGFWLRNCTGAFSDGAILFPLLAALSSGCGFSAWVLFLSAGLAYLAAGLVFRVPMPVQPLKSIAIAAVAAGASVTEVRLSGACLGILCLGLACFDVNRAAEKVPASLIHGLQLGLGVLLCIHGTRTLAVIDPRGHPGDIVFAGALVLGGVVFSSRPAFPFLGVLAAAGMVAAIVQGLSTASHPAAFSAVQSSSAGPIRAIMLLSLVLPQLALTLGNSVLGTQDVSRRYYGARAGRVTVTRLLRSIGIGNVASAAIGGLPYCHGAGGVTAHFRGGATHWVSNVLIGAALLAFAGLSALAPGGFGLKYPAPLLAALLVTVGLFHVKLAAPSWNCRGDRIQMVAMGATALLTRNMLWVLAVGACFLVSRSCAGFVRRGEADDPV